MPVHKVIQGSTDYLPFALSKLRQLAVQAERTGGYAAQKFYVDDGSTVLLRVALEHHFITITSALRYEFFTPDHINSDTIGSPGYEGFVTGIPHAVGSFVRAVLGGGSPQAIYSSSPEVVSADGSWRAAMPDDPAPNKTRGGGAAFPIKEWPISHGAWQSVKAFEYTNWPGNKNDALVTSTQCMAPGLNNQSNWMSAYTYGRIANTGAFIADYGTDVPPVHYDARGSMMGAPGYDHAEIWWRRAAVQTVDGRKFFICTDNVGRFQVYPAKDYIAIDGPEIARALPDDRYVMITPPYPEWVTLPIPGGPSAVTHGWLWAFNSDATRAVTCPFNSTESPEFVKAYRSFVYAGSFLPDDATEDDYPENPIPAREDIPGMVEVKIIITVTGSEDMDFTASIELGRVIYSGDEDGRFIFDAAYTLKDKGSDLMLVAEDTLVVAEVETFTSPGGYDPGPVPLRTDPVFIGMFGPGPESIQVARRTESFFIITAFDEQLAATEVVRRKMLKRYGTRFFTPNGVRRAREADAAGYLVGTYQHQVGPVPYALAFDAEFDSPLDGDPAVPGSAGAWAGYINSLELRTLSFAYIEQDQIAGTERYELWAYNKLVKSFDRPFGDGKPGPYVACTEKIPSTATYIHQLAVSMALNTLWGQGFCIHPAGHWSYSEARGGEGLDIVQVKGKKPKTHRDLFNKAFGQAREYSYYRKYWDPDTRLFTEDTGGTRWDNGSFRFNGVWITF